MIALGKEEKNNGWILDNNTSTCIYTCILCVSFHAVAQFK